MPDELLIPNATTALIRTNSTSRARHEVTLGGGLISMGDRGETPCEQLGSRSTPSAYGIITCNNRPEGYGPWAVDISYYYVRTTYEPVIAAPFEPHRSVHRPRKRPGAASPSMPVFVSSTQILARLAPCVNAAPASAVALGTSPSVSVVSKFSAEEELKKNYTAFPCFCSAPSLAQPYN